MGETIGIMLLLAIFGLIVFYAVSNDYDDDNWLILGGYMSQYYNDLLYGDKRFVVKNDSFDVDLCGDLRADTGVFKQTTSRDYICDMGDSFFSIKDKLLALEKDHNALREEYRQTKFEDIGKLVNRMNSLMAAVGKMRGESDKRTMSGIVRDPNLRF